MHTHPLAIQGVEQNLGKFLGRGLQLCPYGGRRLGADPLPAPVADPALSSHTEHARTGVPSADRNQIGSGVHSHRGCA